MFLRQLEHGGPEFPAFTPRQKTLKCAGKPDVRLGPEAEEIAVSWARFCKRAKMPPGEMKRAWRNFAEDFAALLSRDARDVRRCDFQALLRAHAPASGSRRELDPQKMKKSSEGLVVIVDGRRVQADNPHVTPAGVFSGRGKDNELLGRVRRRIRAEDVTLNISRGAPVPPVPRGHGRVWGGVVHEQRADWIAKWKDPVTGKFRYVRLAPEEKAERVRKKFDLARGIRKKFAGIIKRNARNLASLDARTRQLATCVALICELGIRIGRGGSKRVFGAATLQVRHLVGGKTLSFVGKDGVPYEGRITNARVIKNLSALARGKAAKARLFDIISPRAVNEYLSELDPRLTAKVIRTIRANEEFEAAVRAGRGAAEARLRSAIEHVAAFCNHRTGPGFERLSARTSLAHYLDPRTVFAWAHDLGADPAAVFSRALARRLRWASVSNS